MLYKLGLYIYLYRFMATYKHDAVVPNVGSELNKKKQVAAMFDSIAFRYDFLNRFLSGGVDVYWRKKAIAELKELAPQKVLDVATGTADVALLTHKILAPEKIIGIDISEGMLQYGHEKIKQRNLQNHIELQLGDSETINFTNNTFNAITVAFGVRNFENLEKGLAEMLRVLQPGGKLVVLEFSKPTNWLFKPIYGVYMNYIAPAFGKLFSNNRQAYAYLNESVLAFPERENFVSILNKVGYQNTYFKPLSLGICCIYCGYKR